MPVNPNGFRRHEITEEEGGGVLLQLILSHGVSLGLISLNLLFPVLSLPDTFFQADI